MTRRERMRREREASDRIVRSTLGLLLLIYVIGYVLIYSHVGFGS